MSELTLLIALAAALLVAWLAWRVHRLSAGVEELARGLGQGLEEKRRAMLGNLHGELASQSERIGSTLAASSDRLRTSVGDEPRQTRETLHALQISLGASLADSTEKLNLRIVARLGEIAGKVNERFDEGLRKTNDLLSPIAARDAA